MDQKSPGLEKDVAAMITYRNEFMNFARLTSRWDSEVGHRIAGIRTGIEKSIERLRGLVERQEKIASYIYNEVATGNIAVSITISHPDANPTVHVADKEMARTFLTHENDRIVKAIAEEIEKLRGYEADFHTVGTALDAAYDRQSRATAE